MFGRMAGPEAALAKGDFPRGRPLRDVEIHVPITIDLLTKGDVDARKRNVMFPIVAILPVELVAFNFIRSRCLDSVIAEGNQVELSRIAVVR